MNGDRKAHIAYFIRFGIGVILYSLGVLIAGPWARSMGGSPWRFAVSLLPMIGAGVCAWAMARMFQEIDEMQARKMLDALVVSVAGTVLTCLAYGFLEGVGAPLLSAAWVVGVWGLYFCVGTLWSTWRYR